MSETLLRKDMPESGHVHSIQSRAAQYALAILAVGLVTGVMAPFAGQINSTTVALVLLLVILLAAAAFESGPALVASFVAVLCLNFFFLPPLYTLTIADSQNWVALIAFMVTAMVAGQLSAYAKRRAAESESRRIEIARLYDELQGAFAEASKTEALQQSEQLKSALLDAVTHDLRTPLTSIKASVTTLLEEGKSGTENLQLDSEARTEFLEIINEETDRLNNFIGGMVNLARIQAGDLHLRKSWTPVDDIVRNAVDRFGRRFSAVRLILDIEEESPAVFVDADSITAVLYSIVDNAAKYSPENASIRVAVKRVADEMIEFSVEDHGPGIDISVRERVFDKFFRAAEDDIHSTASGLGLGLAIARGIVETQGGSIWITDGHDGYVTCVTFKIPIGDDEDAETAFQ